MTTTATSGSTLDPVQETGRLHEAWARRSATIDDPLADLLRHLHAEVPYYRGGRAGRLAGLPVVDRALHRARGDEFRAVGTTPAYTITSSGSTGEPLAVGLDEAAWYAVNYHFFSQIVELAGVPTETFHPGAVAVAFVSNKPSRRAFVRPLPGLRHGLYARVQLDAPADRLAALFDRLRPPVLYGKPTYLLDLRQALLRAGVDRPTWTPRLLLTSGEPLHRDDRARLTGYFGAPLVDALASTEGGLIAATRPDEPEYDVFGDNVRLEVRTDGGPVAATGEGELLVTNLVYRDTVFARYRTGDRAVLAPGRVDGAQRLARLWGREPREVRFRTGTVPADTLTDRLGLLPGLADFQVRTAPSGAVLRWTPDDVPADPEPALREVMAELLPGEDVRYERCARITPPGGKKRRFV
ncbi:AMP-binding protein [Micromonospora sp. WMMD882]|uniref:AMP-binding protein n=1 Tax=Micromonospora sp. WMMD882 TaxID=3015151 RepID=UPI00248B6FB3|nr:AMP-binding protein [Micromonospora sp. WMMD882]WBB78442.1 AMP-binding protein [Micromonospora sp. WMMD882]